MDQKMIILETVNWVSVQGEYNLKSYLKLITVRDRFITNRKRCCQPGAIIINWCIAPALINIRLQ